MPEKDLRPVMDRARELARISGLGYIGLAHIALAMFEQVEGPLRRVLVEDCGVDLESLVKRLDQAMPRQGGSDHDPSLAFSPELKRLFEEMLEIRRAAGADRFGMEHLCAAVFGSPNGAWRVFLDESGLDADTIARLALERGSEFLELEMQQVDVFTPRLFGGNPAAVVPLRAWLPAALMQAIAAENNLSETAFTVPRGEEFQVRWFTPTAEVDFCGHATIAAARVLLDTVAADVDQIRFHSAAGPLRVVREGERLVLDGPRFRCEPLPLPADAAALVGVPVQEAFTGGGDLVLVVADEAAVRAANPDIKAIARLEQRAVAVTARGDEVDFVSRFFAPKVGVPEDPATGSVHCVLAPLWGERLGKTELRAAQLSRRGGELLCRLAEDRVEVAGRTRVYLRGRIRIPRDIGPI